MIRKIERKVVNTMAVIRPVSDLRNYNTVLEKVAVGFPVYLTVNGRGRYMIRDIEEDEEFEKPKALLRLIHSQPFLHSTLAPRMSHELSTENPTNSH
ncbi:MAG: hypothetical protein K5989_04290 [Lachnospiraceae bacterium]|nr:hypothetical protein [Lachnospiraceae bacterium]